MSYTTRTCSDCGFRAPQPEMVRRTVEREVSRSRDSVSGETIFGAFIGNKTSQRKLERTILRTGDRTYTRKEQLWFCASCAGSHDKKVNARGFLSTALALVLATPFVLVALGSKGNDNSSKSNVAAEAQTSVDKSLSPVSMNETSENSREPFEEGEEYSQVEASATSRVDPSPSFDCGRARLPTEIAVCASDSLSSLDVRLQSDYDTAGGVVPAEVLIKFGRKLFRERVSCGDDRECLIEKYKKSIETIRQLTQLSEVILKTEFNSLGTSERIDLQMRMKEQGFYGGKLDGVWGVGTRDAMYLLAFAADESGTLDSRRLLQAMFEGSIKN